MKAQEFQSARAPIRPGRLPALLLFCFIVIFAVTAIKPFNRQDWFLENIPVFAALAVLVGTYRWFQLSNVSYVLLAIFLTLHAVGAHYTYSEVPIGYWVRDWLHLGRNHYDRVVHFTFGLLLTYPVRELLVSKAGLRGIWSFVLPAHVIFGWSGLYEIVEAIVAQLTSPELGAAYNGTQGDIWDAQKDMALAALGAALCMALTFALARNRDPACAADKAQGVVSLKG